MQKYALSLCTELDLFSYNVEDVVLTGPMVLDLCQWGFKEIEIVYKISGNDLSKFLKKIYLNLGNRSGYKHVMYMTGDIAIQFYYKDWEFTLWVTTSKYNYRKILFSREYLIENLAPEGRELIVSLCKSNTPLGMAIKSAITSKYGMDHALTRLSDFQVGDIRYDSLKPTYKLIPFVSGLAIYEWENENQTWRALKTFPDLVYSGVHLSYMVDMLG